MLNPPTSSQLGNLLKKPNNCSFCEQDKNIDIKIAYANLWKNDSMNLKQNNVSSDHGRYSTCKNHKYKRFENMHCWRTIQVICQRWFVCSLFICWCLPQLSIQWSSVRINFISRKARPCLLLGFSHVINTINIAHVIR